MSMTSGGSSLGRLAMDLRQLRVESAQRISSHMRQSRASSRVKKCRGLRMLKMSILTGQFIVEILYDCGV